ncbi:MAG: endolytic transglycosylase MltG [Magnetococcus sp. YQC-5]
MKIEIKRLILKIVLGVLITGSVILGGAAFSFWRFLNTPLETPKLVLIDKGWNLNRIAKFLEDQEVISSAQWFLLLVYYHDYQEKRPLTLHAGEYQFIQGELPARILSRMQHGDVVRYKFSFPEGLTAKEIAARMLAQGWSDAPQLMQDAEVIKKLHLPAKVLEGWLFPETYFFTRGVSTFEMLSRMTRMTRKILDQEWPNRSPGYALTPQETLILASIIEKETGQASERNRISGVFHNRMRRNMRLESDPTVIYGLTDFTGDLTHNHLITPTPFNTYTNLGLPPSPICNPGLASIHAALHPDNHTELFFVAQGDGSHVFSKTFQEHKANVNRLQKSKKTNPPKGKNASE